ncbi:MAG TPA: AAA family ATPase, partial [Candidatus Merdenecus merdavium]|nr:AAA family ATPase [Candidatus Merdenecus merdavium]
MVKGKTTVYFCQNCGHESTKWMGKCPGCKEWNTFVEELVDKKSVGKGIKKESSRPEPMTLSKITTEEDDRIDTKIEELDRVLGGGIVQGSLILVGGDPGIGKSTLLLQVCKNLSDQDLDVLYISGEESLKQIKLRAKRIGEFTESLRLLCETNLDTISEVIQRLMPKVVVIDSIQTMYKEEISSAP